MSDWNTKDIRAFKETFKKSQSAYIRSMVLSPTAADDQARQMLAKRMSVAATTFGTVDEQVKATAPDLVKGLRVRQQELARASRELLSESVQGGDSAKSVDSRTDKMIAMTDEWIKFEASCISARNQAAAGKDDKGVRDRLRKRTEQLFTQASKLASSDGPKNLVAGAKDCFDELRKMLALIMDGSGAFAPEPFGRALDKLRSRLDDLTLEIAKTVRNGDEILRDAMTTMYGLTVTPTAKKGEKMPEVPYKALLEAFGMVPSDHAINPALEKLIYSKLGQGSGDYRNQTIYIDVNVKVDGARVYRDPETAKDVAVNDFAVTTLHEIGHSVDTAYKIMDSCQSEKGCGGWKAVDPAIYVEADGFEKFKQQMRKFASGDPFLAAALESDIAKREYLNLAMNLQTMEDFTGQILGAREVVVKNRLAVLIGQFRTLVDGLDQHFEKLIPGSKVSEGFVLFRSVFATQITALTVGDTVFAIGELETEYGKAFGGDVVVSGAPGVPQLRKWLHTQFDKYRFKMVDLPESRRADLANAVKELAPKPIDVSMFIETANPWERDISGETINGKPASHRGYSYESLWWQYSGGDRKSTYVSSYQWRSPSEWFAELYAITWLNKVEPPPGVGGKVRPYLFGGSIGGLG